MNLVMLIIVMISLLLWVYAIVLIALVIIKTTNQAERYFLKPRKINIPQRRANAAEIM